MRKNRFVTYLIDNRGVSLAEVMVSVAILGVAALVFLQWVHYFSLTTGNTNKNDSIDNTMLRVSSAFGESDQYCGDILKNTRLVTTEPAGASVASIDFHDQNHSLLENVVKIGGPVEAKQDLVMSDIRLIPVTALSTDIIIAKLELTFKKANVLGPSVIVRWLPIYTTVKNNVVDSCSTSANSVVALKIRMCEINSDGFNHYDPISDSCIMNSNVKWTYGLTSFEAVCEPGWIPAISTLNPHPDWIACASETPAMVTLPPRSYLRAGPDASATNSWFAAMDNPPTKCTFSYVVGVDSSLYRPKIKCVEAGL